MLTSEYELPDSFHSINVPSEWGHSLSQEGGFQVTKVSIQLMSPASGDKEFLRDKVDDLVVSIQLMSPASGDA